MNTLVLLDPPPGLASAGAPAPSRPGVAAAITSLADLLALIQSHPEVPPHRRRFVMSHIRTCARIAGRAMGIDSASPGAIPCSLPKLNDLLFTAPPAAHGLTQDSFTNSVSGLRWALAFAGHIPPAAKATLPVDSQWHQLVEAIPDTFAQIGIARFAAWCHDRSISPEAVRDETLVAFEQFVRGQELRADIPDYMRTITKAWQKAARLMTEWPRGLLRPPERRKVYTLPISSFPTSLQDDFRTIERRLARAGASGPFRGEGPAHPLRPRSIKTRLYQLRQAASALTILGREPATILSLADLVEKDAFSAILLFFWRRAIETRIERGQIGAEGEPPPEAGVTAQTGGIASALMMVARYHAKLEPEAVEGLANLARDLQPPRQTAISPKNRERLDRLRDPRARARLLALPRKLMGLAEEFRTQRAKKAVQLAMAAAAIEIELHFPLRIENLTKLELGTHLKRLDPRSGRLSLLTFPDWRVKNGLHLQWPIDPETATFLDRYIHNFRGLIAKPDNRWLFPAADGSNAPRSIDGLRYAITEPIREHVGLDVNVHLFRAFLGTLILEESPGALEDVRLLLGHKSLATALAYYAYVSPTHAAQRMTEVLKRARRTTPQLTKARSKRRGS